VSVSFGHPRKDGAFRLVKAILIGTIVVFGLAAGYMSFLIFDRQESLSRTPRFEVAWAASQGANEFIRLFQRVTALSHAAPGSAAHEEVLLRFEILRGRLSLFESADFRAFIEQDEERQSIMRRLAASVAQLDGTIRLASDPETAQQIVTIIAPLEADLVGLASEAANFSSAQITAFEQELLQLHQSFSTVAVGFFFLRLGVHCHAELAQSVAGPSAYAAGGS
jgi:hypothetical protein